MVISIWNAIGTYIQYFEDILKYLQIHVSDSLIRFADIFK